LDLWIFRDHLHISPSHFSEIFDIPCNSSGITCGKKIYISNGRYVREKIARGKPEAQNLARLDSVVASE
jgi:hypothetical protein